MHLEPIAAAPGTEARGAVGKQLDVALGPPGQAYVTRGVGGRHDVEGEGLLAVEGKSVGGDRGPLGRVLGHHDCRSVPTRAHLARFATTATVAAAAPAVAVPAAAAAAATAPTVAAVAPHFDLWQLAPAEDVPFGCAQSVAAQAQRVPKKASGGNRRRMRENVMEGDGR